MKKEEEEKGREREEELKKLRSTAVIFTIGVMTGITVVVTTEKIGDYLLKLQSH